MGLDLGVPDFLAPLESSLERRQFLVRQLLQGPGGGQVELLALEGVGDDLVGQ